MLFYIIVWVLIAIPCFSLLFFIFGGDPRFRHPVDPMIAILAGVGIVYLTRRAVSLYQCGFWSSFRSSDRKM
jgi:hypothetical protein